MDAIERAFELAAPYTSASITIYMYSGTNYLVRGDRNYYMPKNIDRNSQNLQLTITSASGSQDVTIINKIRGMFQIPISASLTFSNIIVDSIDSSFDCKISLIVHKYDEFRLEKLYKVGGYLSL
jgi:hypothetical protein